jgi:hypothetical protein
MGGDGIMEIQLGFNTTTPPGEKYQVGGTLNTTFDEMAFRVRKRGEDARGLGRWSWQELHTRHQRSEDNNSHTLLPSGQL